MNIADLIAESKNGKEFPLPFGNVLLSPELCVYFGVLRKYSGLSDGAKREFLAYYAACNSIEDVLKQANNYFIMAMRPIFEEICKDLISMDIYDVDTEAVLNYAEKHNYFTFFESAYAEIEDAVAEIDGDLEEKRRLREQRKEGRGRYSVTTFGGIGDAVSNQMKVDMLNGAIGLGHSMRNSAENALDKSAAGDKKRKLFSAKTQNSLANGVQRCAIRMADLLGNMLNEKIPEKPFRFILQVEADKAERLCNNLENIPEEKRPNVLTQILELDPSQDEFYSYMLRHYGDADGALQQLAEFACRNYTLLGKKEKAALDYVQSLTIENEEQVAEARQALEDYCEKLALPMEEAGTATQYIDDLSAKIEREYCIVVGVECSNRDAADKARQELPDIEAFMADICPPPQDALLDYEEHLNEKKAEFEARFSSEITKKYTAQMDEYLQQFNRQFMATGTFGGAAASRKDAGKVRLMNYVKKLTVNDDDEYVRMVADLEKKLPLYGLTRDEAASAFDELAKKVRTVNGVLCSTREAANLARQELEPLKAFMQDICPPSKDALLDYEQDLLEKKATFEATFSSEIAPQFHKVLEENLRRFNTQFMSMGFLSVASDRKQAGKYHLMEYVKTQNVTTAEAYEKKATEIEEKLPLYGLTREEANEAFETLSKPVRTVDGQECTTIEAAEKARSELEGIRAFMSDICPPQKDALLDYEQNLQQKREELNKRFNSELVLKYQEVIDRYLEQFERQFMDVGFFTVVENRKQAGQARLTKLAKSMEINSDTDYAQAVDKLREVLPLYGLTEDEAAEAFAVLDKQKHSGYKKGFGSGLRKMFGL